MAKEALGRALYASGQFEAALMQFQRVARLRPKEQESLDWISRCEETIKTFLAATKIEKEIVGLMLKDPILCNWRDVLEICSSSHTLQAEKPHHENQFLYEESKNDMIKKEEKERSDRKQTGLLMGRLHQDMLFLDKISKHPALQKNILKVGEEQDKLKEMDSVLSEIKGAALDGLTFLEVRKTFWETKNPPVAHDNKSRQLRRTKSDTSRISERTRFEIKK